MTIPTLMTKVHRQKVETKIRKFHSTINQAIRLSIADNDDIPFMDTTDLVNSYNSDKILAWYNEYIVKYMSGASIKKLDTANVKITLKDGSAFTSYLQHESDWAAGSYILWVFYCVNAADKACVGNSYNGKDTFLFHYYSADKIVMPECANESMARCKQRCYTEAVGQRHCCAELIKKNGWKIPDDYPWIK